MENWMEIPQSWGLEMGTMRELSVSPVIRYWTVDFHQQERGMCFKIPTLLTDRQRWVAQDRFLGSMAAANRSLVSEGGAREDSDLPSLKQVEKTATQRNICIEIGTQI
jgi:hypothetical protein